MELANINAVCFTASYAVVLVLEVASLFRRFGWHRLLMLGVAAAGVFAHAAFLTQRARGSVSPLASPSEWSSVAALSLAFVYLVISFRAPRQSIGLFLLPLVLALLGVSSAASDQPFAPDRASLWWGRVHGGLLLLATVSVVIGFLAGTMYLIQSWRLKHKLPPSTRLRLPSLETLENINSRALGLSAVLVAGGFASGLLLVDMQRGGQDGSVWGEPLVISLTVMLLWLIAAQLFGWLYPAARRGRKVAYLTVASFGFLVLVLVSLMWTGASHGAAARRPEQAARGASRRPAGVDHRGPQAAVRLASSVLQ